MATQQEVSRGAKKYEEYVERQLDAAGNRVQRLDLLKRGLIFLVAALGYAVLVIGLDLGLTLPTLVRVAALSIFVLGVLGFAGITLWQLLSLRVNPYYAARQLEKTLPDAKGSVVNYLDLRDESLPPAIRQTISHQAAKDVAEADVEQAIGSRANLWLTGFVTALFVGVLVLFLMGPGRFLSLFQRAFNPFQEIEIATQTEIALVQPADGHLTIGPGDKVHFRIRVSGRIPPMNQPDSLRLFYRYNQNDPHIEHPLDRDGNGEWYTTLQADQVQSGFWYYISGGDTRTAEYQVRVVSIPQVLRYEVVYKPRPYQAQADRKVVYPNERAVLPHIKDYAGTDVMLTIHTNRVLRNGALAFTIDGKQDAIAGEAIAGDPKASQFFFTLRKSGTFTVRFTSKEGEPNTDLSGHTLEVLTDLTPNVELTKPGKDVQLAANAMLHLEGEAIDDLGIKLLQLQMKVVKGSQQTLKTRLYREGKFPVPFEGRYADRVEYKDAVDLAKVESVDGRPLKLQAGWELEYWLEAIDNSDYPSKTGNVGRSKSYKVLLTEPEQDKKKQDEDRKQAEKQQQDHQKKQDQKEAERQEKEKQEREKQQSKDGQKGDKKDGEKSAAQKDFEKQQEDLKQKLDDIEKQQKDRASAKGDPGKPEPQAKDNKGGEQQPGGAKKEGPPDQQQAAEKKDAGKDEQGQPQGGQQSQAKDGGEKQPQNPDEQKGQANNQGQQPPEPQAKADDKKGQSSESKEGNGKDSSQAKDGKQDGAQQNGEKQGQAKSDDKQGANQQAGDKKGGEKSADGGQQAEAKDDKKGPPDGAGQQPGQAEAKKDGPKQGDGQPPPAQVKQDGPNGAGQQASEKKDGGAGGEKRLQPNDGNAQAKGPPQDGPKSEAKKGGGQGQPNAQVKNDKQGQGPPQAVERKDGPGKDAEPVNQAKAEREATPREKLERPDQGGEPTLDDLERVKKQLPKDLERLSQEDRDDLLQELKRLEKEAKDPNVRNAAKKLANVAGEEMAKVPAPKPGANEPGQPDKQGDPGSKQPDKQGNPGGGTQHTQGSRGSNDTDGGKALVGTEEFGRKGGDLQLEELRKKLTPEMLRKLKWSKDDAERFLKQGQAYEDWLRQQAKHQPGTKAGQPDDGTSLLPSQAPRKIGSGPASTQPVDARHVQPPPEFREALRLLTGGTPR